MILIRIILVLSCGRGSDLFGGPRANVHQLLKFLSRKTFFTMMAYGKLYVGYCVVVV